MASSQNVASSRRRSHPRLPDAAKEGTEIMSSARHPISGPFVWTGDDLAASGRWIRAFTSDEIERIDRAISAYRRSGRGWREANRDTLPLEGFEALFDDVADELENGLGLFRLRGVPVERHDHEALKAFYLSFGDHLGTPVSQNLEGDRINAIEDEGAKSNDYGIIDDRATGGGFRSSRARAFSSAGLRFHCDRCDVVGLLCVRQAKIGGHSMIASAVAIHNAMLERRPDLLEELFTDYPRSRFGEEVNDASAHYMLPVFTSKNGKFATHYSRTYVEAAQTNPDVPRLRPEQDEALDLLAELAGELCFEMTLQPGDIQLLNNHVMYHAREDFQDDASTGQRRLLFRLWLAMPNSRALHESFAVLFGNTDPGTVRGGIWPPERAYRLPL